MTHIHVLARIRRIRLAREGNGDSAGAGTPRVAETPVALPDAPELRSSGEASTANPAPPDGARAGRTPLQMRRDKAISGVATGK
jgi:hypothetical protein